MLPYDLKKDNAGLLYIENNEILKHQPLELDHRHGYQERYYQNGFFKLYSSVDYIVKYSYTVFSKMEQEQIKEMLIRLVSKQDCIRSVDFPIAYFRHKRKLMGLVIKYYPSGISIDNIAKIEDIELFGKYYYHDDDSIHNLFLFFNDVLDTVYEMFENGIYYRDINPGNIIINQNEVKIIDFDYRFVHFDNKNYRLNAIMYTYALLIHDILSKYQLDSRIEIAHNFEEAKVLTKQLENQVRKG